MTVENRTYMDVVDNENDAECCEQNNDNICDNEQNNDNIYPLGGELMVAIRPVISNCNLPLMSKINIKKSKEAHDIFEKEILSNTNDKEIVFNSNKLSSPVKRTSACSPNKESPIKLIHKLSASNLSPIKTPSLSQQLSHSADSSHLHSAIKHVHDTLSQSCFAELTSEKKNSDIDSELTCLNWLQGANLLKEFPSAKKNESCEEVKSDAKDVEYNQDLELNTKDPLSAINDVDQSLQKPAYSFSTLIFMAIESSPNKRLPVKDIYQWIQDNFPYFQRASIGWKNSIRHNLSLNKSFKKVDKERCIGKGSLWMIDHQARAGLVQQLRKTSMCNSYPYSKQPYTCSRYFLKDKKLHRRDATGRFLPNHDDAEFDVAAAMCSLSSSTLIDYENNCTQSNRFDCVSSEELLQIWRTCFEPNGYSDDDETSDNESNFFTTNDRLLPENCKYSIKDFLDEVHTKLPSRSNKQPNIPLDSSLNISMDEDYEFDRSDDESSDEEMRENMIRLVEKENDECLGDSGYSEEGTLKNSTMLDHSYSKSVQSLVRPHSKRESNGIDALLHLANAATRVLELLHNREERTEINMDCTATSSSSGSRNSSPTNLHCSESSEVLTEEKSCQFNSSFTVPMS